MLLPSLFAIVRLIENHIKSEMSCVTLTMLSCLAVMFTVTVLDCVA